MVDEEVDKSGVGVVHRVLLLGEEMRRVRRLQRVKQARPNGPLLRGEIIEGVCLLLNESVYYRYFLVIFINFELFL